MAVQQSLFCTTQEKYTLESIVATMTVVAFLGVACSLGAVAALQFFSVHEWMSFSVKIDMEYFYIFTLKDLIHSSPTSSLDSSP